MDHRRCIAPPTMAADRLSGLPDDLLRRILYFAPAREGAATAVLSRRWPGLWATSGAVNLDTRSYDRAHGRDLSFEKRESFLAGAGAALARAQGPVRRLAVDVVAENPFQIYNFLHAPDYYTTEEYSMLAGVLADPAAQHVQELRLRVGAAGDAHGSIKYRLAGKAHGIEYRLGFGALPSRELRLLQITSCTDLAPPPPAAAFPLLAELVLLGCTTSLGGLQSMIDAAPLLAVLHLEHTRLTGALQVVAETDDGAQTRADLHFIDDDCFHEHQQMHQRRKAFWRFVRNFDNAKFLKLELELEHIAVVAEKSRKELLAGKLFSNLEHLELQGRYNPATSSVAAAAIASLLHCCPVVRDLKIRLRNPATERSQSYIQSFIERRTRLEFDKSVDHFRRRIRMVSLGGDTDENYEVVPDIPSLSDQSFNCLQSYLTRVSLRFPLEDRNCFGVQLTKFFAESALVLEEMHVGDGNHKMCEHMNRRVETWIANSPKRRLSARKAGFAVLPLET